MPSSGDNSQRSQRGLNACALIRLLAVVLLVVASGCKRQKAAEADRPLLVYCAAGIRTPVEAVAAKYERETGMRIQIQYGGSQSLLSNLDLSRRGDLFLPADDSYIDLARQKKLVREVRPLAQMSAVVAVAKGNPARVRSFADLVSGSVKVAQANPDAAAIGKLTREALQKSAAWEQLKARTIVFKPTVNDVANDVKLGSVDAGIVWDAVVAQYMDLEAVAIPELRPVQAHIAAAVLQCSAQPAAALRFLDYLASRDEGLREFQRLGYQVTAAK
jgi:molybdate transport system substrate-binding protein